MSISPDSMRLTAASAEGSSTTTTVSTQAPIGGHSRCSTFSTTTSFSTSFSTSTTWVTTFSTSFSMTSGSASTTTVTSFSTTFSTTSGVAVAHAEASIPTMTNSTIKIDHLLFIQTPPGLCVLRLSRWIICPGPYTDAALRRAYPKPRCLSRPPRYLLMSGVSLGLRSGGQTPLFANNLMILKRAPSVNTSPARCIKGFSA